MKSLQDIYAMILADPRYQQNLDWGEPRSGHPEGTVRAHITELEQILERLRAQVGPRLTDEHYWKLKVLIHTHDTFKSEATPGVAITDPRSHASLAAQFLAEYCTDEHRNLVQMVQYHDEGHALWRQFSERGQYNQDRFAKLLETIDDWDLFLWFTIIDGSTEGKGKESLQWFIEEVTRHINTSVTVRSIP